MTAPAPIRWSNLRHMARSAQHYRYNLEHPMEPTPAMRLGTIAHALVLEKAREAVTVYDGRRFGKAWDEFKTTMGHTNICTPLELSRAMALLRTGEVERTVAWRIGQRACNGTPDVWAENSIVDLKITADAHPSRFPWHARKMLWTSQLAWYADGVVAAGLGCPINLYIVAVEPKPPYPVVVYRMTDNAIDMAQRTYHLLWEQLMSCERTNCWPGYAGSIVDLDVPETDEEFALTIEGEEIAL
jgi:hypothetical protein